MFALLGFISYSVTLLVIGGILTTMILSKPSVTNLINFLNEKLKD